MKAIATFLVIVAVLFGGWWLWQNFIYPNFINNAPEAPQTVKINDTLIEVEVASTAAERQRGLSGRESLPQDKGMLFLFLDAKLHPFWMKDMQFALDIIWIGPDLTVVDITKNIQPNTYPEQIFQPKKPAQYILEVNAGFADRNNIKEGDTVELTNISF